MGHDIERGLGLRKDVPVWRHISLCAAHGSHHRRIFAERVDRMLMPHISLGRYTLSVARLFAGCHRTTTWKKR